MRKSLSRIEASDFGPVVLVAMARNRLPNYFAVGVTSLIGSCGEILLLVLPTYLAVIGHAAKLTGSQLGFVASSASGGLLAGSLLSALALSRFSSRLIVRTMLAVAAAVQLLVIFAHSLVLVIAATALAAIAGGLAYGTIYAVLSRQTNPARAFAIFVALQLIFNFVLLFATPHLMELAGGALGLLGLLATCGFVFAALSGFVPDVRIEESAVVDGPRWRAFPVLMALGGFFLFAVGMGATWAYIELVAQGRGFAPRLIEHILSYGQLTALVGALFAMWIGRNRTNPVLLLVGIAASSAGVFAIFVAGDLPLFTVACLLTGAAWNFSLPFQFGTISLLDPTGRAGALASSLHAAGLTVGPLVGAATLMIAPDRWIIAAAAAFMFMALIVFIFPATQLRRASKV